MAHGWMRWARTGTLYPVTSLPISVISHVVTSVKPPSNVSRISRAIRPVCSDGKSQVIFYHAGVGSGGGFIDNIEGTFGIGLDQVSRPSIDVN